MAADMILRDLYLPADITVNVTAANTTASRLCRRATVDDLRVLLDLGWIGDDTLPDADSCTGEQLDARAETLRLAAEEQLHELLDRFAQSLTRRDVSRTRFDHGDSPGVDAYTTGGLSYGDGPTDAFDDWDVVMDTDRFPVGWPDQIGAAAGLLHPWGYGPAVTTVTFRAWAQPDTTA